MIIFACLCRVVSINVNNVLQEVVIDDPEYHAKMLRQKQLREQVLAKKEARRKAAAVIKASEIATRKARQEKENNKKPENQKAGDLPLPVSQQQQRQDHQPGKQHKPPLGRGHKGKSLVRYLQIN